MHRLDLTTAGAVSPDVLPTIVAVGQPVIDMLALRSALGAAYLDGARLFAPERVANRGGRWRAIPQRAWRQISIREG